MPKQKPIQELLKFSILNLDKPSGPTSFSVSDYVRKILNINKTSHAGTLDPQVSGVLPILLGRACRLSDFFMHKNKTYVGIMRLHENILDELLNKEIKNFIGKIKQLPPVRSRVKRAIREREVISFNILEREEKELLFETEVQAGTYIRKLVHDLGEKIQGAHMLELRRIKAGIFDEKDSYNLYDLEKAIQQLKEGNEELIRKMLIPAEDAIKKALPLAQAKKEAIKKLLTGKPLMKNDLSDKSLEEIFALFSKEQFIGIYKSSSEGDIIARALFVFN